MNVILTVLPVLREIRESFPQLMGSVMQAIGKSLVKEIKTALRTGQVYGESFSKLSPQRIVARRKGGNSIGGKYSNGVIYKSTSTGITVGFIFQHKGLLQFLGGGKAKWSKWNNSVLAAIKGDNAPFKKVGEYLQPARPVIDVVANNTTVMKNIQQSAYNRVQQKIGQAKKGNK